jgi:hypothetical protein
LATILPLRRGRDVPAALICCSAATVSGEAFPRYFTQFCCDFATIVAGRKDVAMMPHPKLRLHSVYFATSGLISLVGMATQRTKERHRRSREDVDNGTK